jgi:two-component system, OmpR family, KDP operon response regulator KdpE
VVFVVRPYSDLIRSSITVARILIVDDDPHFLRTLRLALDSHGYEVDAAADGRQALDAVAARVPDLVVLDWHLPRMDGIQTCQALRAQSDVPVIMVSGNRSNSKDTALDAGANDYLSKPFSIGDLLARIESALRL